jgi:nucleotide-binding universal stress UspA family protein
MFGSVLVPLDGSELSERCLPLARRIALATSADVHLAHVHAPALPPTFLGGSPIELQSLDAIQFGERQREEARSYLESVAARMDGDGLGVSSTLLEGSVAHALIEHAARVEADLIVMTTHGHAGMERAWLGSTADSVIRHTSLPILLVHPATPDGLPLDIDAIDNILVTLDGSELSERVLAAAADLAEATGATLTLGHVVFSKVIIGTSLSPHDPADLEVVTERVKAYLERTADRLRQEGLAVQTRITRDDWAAPGIARMAREVDADLIAIATHGHGGLKRAVLGSVADKVLRSSPLPLLVVRPEAEEE